ncbi:MAG TPA: hypothetical protein VMU39_26200 [Solirubrobacteraceae bacterium]|nr:hypothetical protein [Solirubrobacteraceae bacterium]
MRLGTESLWALSLYPEAGEGGGCLSTRRSAIATGNRPNAERAAEEAGRRARGKIRRYAAANRLNRLGTLTYRGEGCHEPLVLREHLASFFRELRDRLDRERFAYVWVPQWHPGGHGLHAHFAVGRFVPRSLIAGAWGHGFVHIKLLDGLPVGSGELAEARLAARYLARYVGRDLDDERRLSGLHRYEVAQGFQPAKIECYGDSAEDVIERASRYMGSAPERVWLSSSVEGWRGPPACWAQWN